MKIYVGNLAPDVTEEALRAAFGSYGEAFVRLMRDEATGASRGFGYVEMDDDSKAQAAIEGLDGVEMDGGVLVVTEAPRDLGTVQFTRPSLAKSETANAMLLVRGGTGNGSTIELTEGTTTIGRALSNDIVVDEPGISRQHADIRGDSEGYWIADLSSRNGTFVNGVSIGAEPVRLRNTDRVELGGTNKPVYWVYTGP